MKRYARIVSGVVVEIVVIPPEFDLEQCFHSDLVSQMVECPNDVQLGWSYRDGFSQTEATKVALVDIKRGLREAIDQAAEQQRLRFITGGAGQAMTYAQKAEEARLCLNATSPNSEDYPLLAAEVGITAITLVGVAQVVATANAQWLQIGAAIEAARLATKKAISDADTVEDAQAAAVAVVWPFN